MYHSLSHTCTHTPHHRMLHPSHKHTHTDIPLTLSQTHTHTLDASFFLRVQEGGELPWSKTKTFPDTDSLLSVRPARCQGLWWYTPLYSRCLLTHVLTRRMRTKNKTNLPQWETLSPQTCRSWIVLASLAGSPNNKRFQCHLACVRPSGRRFLEPPNSRQAIAFFISE